MTTKLKPFIKIVEKDLDAVSDFFQMAPWDPKTIAFLGLCYARMTLEEAQETCEKLNLMTNARTTDDERQGN